MWNEVQHHVCVFVRVCVCCYYYFIWLRGKYNVSFHSHLITDHDFYHNKRSCNVSFRNYQKTFAWATCFLWFVTLMEKNHKTGQFLVSVGISDVYNSMRIQIPLVFWPLKIISICFVCIWRINSTQIEFLMRQNQQTFLKKTRSTKERILKDAIERFHISKSHRGKHFIKSCKR